MILALADALGVEVGFGPYAVRMSDKAKLEEKGAASFGFKQGGQDG